MKNTQLLLGMSHPSSSGIKTEPIRSSNGRNKQEEEVQKLISEQDCHLKKIYFLPPQKENLARLVLMIHSNLATNTSDRLITSDAAVCNKYM